MNKYSLRLQAVQTYLREGKSLRIIAARLNIPYLTLWCWVKWYKEGGEENLKRDKFYKRPWNKRLKELEEKIVFVKERKPSLTLKEARQQLIKQNINISIKGIWNIWHRYGYTGSAKKPQSLDANYKIQGDLPKIEKHINENNLKEAARILNSLPHCPNSVILEKMPERYLSLRRRLDKLEHRTEVNF